MNSVAAANLLAPLSLCLVFILLVPFTIAGLALINTGLGRSRSAAHAMTASLCVICIAVLVYFAWGFSVQGYWADTFNGFHLEMTTPPGLFFRGVDLRLRPLALAALLSLFSVALSSLIPLGAAADRWRLSAVCLSTAVFAGCTYPIFARLAWFVVPLTTGVNLGHAFLDGGGSGVIQVAGGLTALSVAWLLGPRRGKYSPNGMPAAIPAHNGVYVVFGCMLAWVGWMGLNSAGAILYAGSPAENSLLVAINTTFSAMAAALTAAVITKIRFRKPDASLIANGWVGGLVASSAGCASLKPATAVLTGFVAGALVVLAIEFLEFTLKIDDPCGSVSVHAVAGIWGLLAVGIFSGSGGQLLAQLVGVATLLGFILPLTYGLNWLLGRFIPYRVSVDGERQGLDLHELGADAYPEFAVHGDEFMQR
jgi:Amt family ammonium transporter